MSIDASGTASAAPFPSLRACYMRVIARAWQDEQFLEKTLLPYNGRPRGALELFQEEYKFTFPFNVKFAISVKHRPHWRPKEMFGWFAYADEFHIQLPDPPPDQWMRADAIGAYCQAFPSMLGMATDGKTQPPDDFDQFGVITARLLAIAWHDEHFKHLLTHTEDARSIVQASMGVVVHWNFKLRFSFLKWDEFWGVGRHQMLLQGHQINPRDLPVRTTITVHLPAKPDLDEAFWPIALAAYNDTGPQFPFTCA